MTTPADLLELRRRYSWSQERLAQELGVSRASVSRWERGARPIPKTAGLAFCWLQICCRELEAEDNAKRPRASPVDEADGMLDV